MFRLLNGSNIDTLTLARNARASLELIDWFYGAPPQGKMIIGKLPNKRNSRLWERDGKEKVQQESGLNAKKT